jgi:hypothetical protein
MLWECRGVESSISGELLYNYLCVNTTLPDHLTHDSRDIYRHCIVLNTYTSYSEDMSYIIDK